MTNVTSNEKSHPAPTECEKKNLYEELETTALMLNEKIQVLIKNEGFFEEFEACTKALNEVLSALICMQRKKEMCKSGSSKMGVLK